jgi:ABC-type multidrug transport system fused ATPase/permease subunit
VLNNDVFVQNQEIGFFDQARTGELISRLGGDTNVLKDAATSNISMGLRWCATVVGGVLYLLYVSWKLTLVMLAVVPAVAVSARLYGKYTKRLSKATRQALAEATEVAEESLSHIRTGVYMLSCSCQFAPCVMLVACSEVFCERAATGTRVPVQNRRNT